MHLLFKILLIALLLTPISVYAQQNIDDSIIFDSDTTIYTIVEQEPEFPGGISKLMSFIMKNLDLKEAIEKDSTILNSGRFIFSFVVEKDGTLTNFEYIRGHEAAREVILEVVNKMPLWKPGVHKGKNVRVKYILPIYICFR